MANYQEDQSGVWRRDKKSLVEGGLRWLGAALSALAVGYSTYLSRTLADLDHRLKDIELRDAAASGNRFTSTDWARERTIISTDFNTLDKRITRLEDNRLRNLKEIP